MDPEIYINKFVPWHESVKNEAWNFKEEFVKYCVADVVLLAKAVLKFRGLFLNLVQVDPWRYTTLSSLCMAIYRSKFFYLIIQSRGIQDLTEIYQPFLKNG